MLGKTTNPLLQKTEQAIEAKVKPEQRQSFQKIVTAGMKLMYSEKVRQGITKELQRNKNIPDVVGNGIAKLLGTMMSQSKGTMPMQAAIPAATVLLCEALDFVEQAGLVKVGNDVLAKTMLTFNASFMQLIGATPDKLQAMIQAAKQAKAGQPMQQSAQPAPQPAPQPTGLVAAAQGA